MSGELYIVICAVLGAGLFALGGTDIPYFKRGFKFLRRELLPISWGLLAYSAGLEWWRCLGLVVCFDALFRLPYGDRTPVWGKFIVFMAMPLASLWLGFNAWQVIAGIASFIMWASSNWKPTERVFSWVTACIIIGLVLGIAVGSLIAQTLLPRA